MNPIACQTLTARMLDGAELDAADQFHIEHCASCAELRRTVAETAPAFAALNRSAATIPAPGEASLRRVREMALRRLATGASPAPVRATAPPETPDERWPALLHWFGGLRMARAALAVACLVAVAALGVRWQATRTLGAVDFALRTVDIDGGTATSRIQGLPSDASLRRGDHVSAREQGALIGLAATGVRLAMAPGAELVVTGPRAIELRSGEIWLDVDPRGKGFTVRTGHGTATVAGTVFGVDAGKARMRVDVVRGEVVVSQSNERRSVTPSRTVSATREGGVGLVEPRVDGEELPAWVTALKRAEDAARAGMYMPSVETRNAH